jgi:hypothetical protein
MREPTLVASERITEWIVKLWSCGTTEVRDALGNLTCIYAWESVHAIEVPALVKYVIKEQRRETGMYTIKAVPVKGEFEDLLEVRFWSLAYRTAESLVKSGRYVSLKIIKQADHPGSDRVVMNWSAQTRKWSVT